MNTTMKLIKAAPLAVALLYSATASADVTHTVEFTNIVGSWINAVPSVTITGNGTINPQARWGDPVGSGGQSGYDFLAYNPTVPANVVVPPSPSGDIELGKFTHINQPITGTSLDSIQLKIDSLVKVDGTSVGTKSFIFDFTHDETPNNANPCANGQSNGQGVNINGCADHVTLSYNGSSDIFYVDSDQYTLNILGFKDLVTNELTSSYWTIEQNNNNANLIANVALYSQVIGRVPEPGSIALLGIGLLGLAGLRQQRRVCR